MLQTYLASDVVHRLLNEVKRTASALSILGEHESDVALRFPAKTLRMFSICRTSISSVAIRHSRILLSSSAVKYRDHVGRHSHRFLEPRTVDPTELRCAANLLRWGVIVSFRMTSELIARSSVQRAARRSARKRLFHRASLALNPAQFLLGVLGDYWLGRVLIKQLAA